MYDIVSSSEQTCKVVGNGSIFGKAYSGDIVIPSTISYEGKTYTVTSIGSDAFYWCGNLKSVTIPATITSIESEAFRLTNGYTIYNYASVPQSLGSSTFDGIPYPTVHVYKGCKNAYTSTNEWSRCTIIDDIEPIKITSIESEKKDIECYPYEGTKVSYSVQPTNASIKDLLWTSSDETILHVESDGTFVGVNKGDAIVTGKAKDGSNTNIQFNVRVNDTRGDGSYKRHLSSITTGESSMSIGNIVNRSVGFNLANNGTNFIKVTELLVKNPNNNYAVVSKSTDALLLGWLAPGKKIALSISLTSNIPTCYEWHYTYKGKEYVFCSDEKDPANKHDITYYVDDEVYVTYELDFGDEIFPEEEPTKEGYTFSGWSEIPETMPAKDVVVTGNFTSTDAIDDVTVNDDTYQIYTLDGKPIGALQKGVNIIRLSGGQIKKVLVK